MAETKKIEKVIDMEAKKGLTLAIDFRAFEKEALKGFATLTLLDKNIEQGKGQMIQKWPDFRVVAKKDGTLYLSEPTRFDKKTEKEYPHYKAPQNIKDYAAKIIQENLL